MNVTRTVFLQRVFLMSRWSWLYVILGCFKHHKWNQLGKLDPFKLGHSWRQTSRLLHHTPLLELPTYRMPLSCSKKKKAATVHLWNACHTQWCRHCVTHFISTLWGTVKVLTVHILQQFKNRWMLAAGMWHTTYFRKKKTNTLKLQPIVDLLKYKHLKQ